jgi:MFS family permease
MSRNGSNVRLPPAQARTEPATGNLGGSARRRRGSPRIDKDRTTIRERTMSGTEHASRRASTMIVCAAMVFGLTFGIRSSQSIFISPINTATGLGVATIALAFGIGQLMWGVTQPIAGVLAARFGNGPVLVSGALMIAAGTALTPFASTGWALIGTVGVLSMGGSGLAGPPLLMAALYQLLPPARRAMATSIVNAGGSFGQFSVVPIAQLLTA